MRGAFLAPLILYIIDVLSIIKFDFRADLPTLLQ